jgi:small-conductance mechanosensitive channel
LSSSCSSSCFQCWSPSVFLQVSSISLMLWCVSGERKVCESDVLIHRRRNGKFVLACFWSKHMHVITCVHKAWHKIMTSTHSSWSVFGFTRTSTTYVWLPDMFLWSILSAIMLIDTSLQRREEDFFSPYNPTWLLVPHPETLLSFLFLWCRATPTKFVRLDQDILTPLAGKKKLYTFETTDFWEQLKTPG